MNNTARWNLLVLSWACLLIGGLTGCQHGLRQTVTDQQFTPTKAQQLVAQAAERYAAGQPRTAWELLQRARRLDPRETSGLELAIAVTRDLSEPAAHRLAVHELAAALPNSSTTQHRVGLELVRLQESQAGLRHLEAAVALAPRNAAFARDLAAAYYAQGMPLVAADVLQQAQTRLPRDASLTQTLTQLQPRSERSRLRDWIEQTAHAELSQPEVADADTTLPGVAEPPPAASPIALVAYEEPESALVPIPRRSSRSGSTSQTATESLDGAVLDGTAAEIQFVAPPVSTTDLPPSKSPLSKAGYIESLIPTELRPLRIIPLSGNQGPIIRPRLRGRPATDLAPVIPQDLPLTVPIARDGEIVLKITPKGG